MRNKLYVVISEVLSPIYGAVQGGHAVAQFLIDNGSQQWNNEYLIYVVADIEKTISCLDMRGIKYSIFKEPDLDGKITALAVNHENSYLKKCKLLK